MDAETDKSLPMPKRGETRGNLQRRTITTIDQRKKRVRKGLVQMNIKALPDVRDRLDSAWKKARGTDATLTKGEFLELLLARWESDEPDIGKAVEAARRADDPPAVDKARGRTVLRPLFLTPGLSAAVDNRAKKEGWTFSATVEHVCVEVAKAMSKRKAA